MSWCCSGSDSIGTASNIDPAPEAINLKPGIVQAVDVEEARKASIGAWCFLDHYGPDEVSRGPGMQVPPHPYIGLQTAPPLPPVPLRPR
jgi:hypothetical protein